MIIVTTKHGSQATFETAGDAARFCNDLHKWELERETPEEQTARRLGKPAPRCDAYDNMPARCNAFDALHANGACDGSRSAAPTYQQLSKVADAGEPPAERIVSANVEPIIPAGWSLTKDGLVRDEPPAEKPMCAPWCGTTAPEGVEFWNRGKSMDFDHCSKACMDAGGPLRPAEQPSRQETGGGEPEWACLPLCGQVRTGDHSQCKAHMRLRELDSGPTCFCTQACRDRAYRDRAKAKAAEQAVYKMHVRIPASEIEVLDQPAEPSGTGQLPSAPVGFRVVGRSGPGVAQSKGLWIRRARDYRDGSPANGEPRQITMPGSLVGVWDAGEYDILEPIAELPAPAVGTLRDAGLTADTMPKEVLAMMYERATDTLIEARQLRKDQVAALNAKLAQAERERDEWRPRYEAAAADARTLREAWARAERERDERGRQVEQMAAHVAKMRVELDEASRVREDKALRERDEMAASREWWMERYNEAAKGRDEATARERERCLEAIETYEPRRDVPADWSYQGALVRIAERIHESKTGTGTDAPAPDRTQECISCGHSPCTCEQQ